MFSLGAIVVFVSMGLSMGVDPPIIGCQVCQSNGMYCDTETKYFICMGKKLITTSKDSALDRNYMQVRGKPAHTIVILTKFAPIPKRVARKRPQSQPTLRMFAISMTELVKYAKLEENSPVSAELKPQDASMEKCLNP